MSDDDAPVRVFEGAYAEVVFLKIIQFEAIDVAAEINGASDEYNSGALRPAQHVLSRGRCHDGAPPTYASRATVGTEGAHYACWAA